MRPLTTVQRKTDAVRYSYSNLDATEVMRRAASVVFRVNETNRRTESRNGESRNDFQLHSANRKAGTEFQGPRGGSRARMRFRRGDSSGGASNTANHS